MSKPSEKDIQRVKGLGFLYNRDSETFSARAVSKNGTLSAEQARNLADCAEKYGSGRLCMTTRLTVELPGIHLEDVQNVQDHVAQVGLVIGGTGPRIRPLTACKGTTCVYGNIDTQALCADLFDKFYLGWRSVTLPHKFKIGIGGCPNSCMKPSLNDFGIEAHRVPAYDMDKCRGCAKCFPAARCPMNAMSVKDGKVCVDPDLCNDCGLCIGKCPFDVTPAVQEPVFAIYVGGTWGKKTRIGTRLERYYTADELENLLAKTILWYRENGFKKERLGAAIDRVGIEAFEAAIAADDLLARKDDIIAAEMKER